MPKGSGAVRMESIGSMKPIDYKRMFLEHIKSLKNAKKDTKT